MSYQIPEHLKAVVYSFINICQDNIRTILNTPVTLSIQVHHSRLTTEQIKTMVVNEYRISWITILSKNRRRPVVNARMAYCWLCRIYLKHTFTRIAESINRDHTTIINAFQTMQGFIDTHDESVKTLHSIIEKINKMYESKEV